MFFQHDLPPPLLDDISDGLGKQPDLFGQLEEGQAKEFQCVHIKVLMC